MTSVSTTCPFRERLSLQVCSVLPFIMITVGDDISVEHRYTLSPDSVFDEQGLIRMPM
jgi:hypothetical protein